MYKLEFTLKQHTPLIHFQHDQDGATLRATEVKPKLDRFIIERMGDGDYEAGRSIAKQKKWLINDQKGALDYKMRMTDSHDEDENERLEFIGYNDPQEGNIEKFKVKGRSPYPMILANMAGQKAKEDLKDLRFYKSIQGAILGLKRDLVKEIESSIKLFFARNNFGNRSNKGYGGFSVIKINDKEQRWEEGLLPPQTTFLKIASSDIKNVFGVIDYFFKWLKSGINYSFDFRERRCHIDRYKKSVLFEYLESRYSSSPEINSNWEKRWIKENYLSLLPLTPSPYKAEYYRALLGLSDKYTFTQAKCNNDPLMVSNFQNNLRGKVELENFNKDIERIKSPITFKVININNSLTKVYILIDSGHIQYIYNNGINRRFTFFKEKTLSINYRIGGKEYALNFNALRDSISELDKHLTRLEPFRNQEQLYTYYNKIEKFKRSLSTIDLPQNKLDYSALIEFFKSRYPSFDVKDFGWRSIVKNVSVEKIP